MLTLSRRNDRLKIRDAIKERIPFRAGAMSAEAWNDRRPPFQTGSLPTQWAERFLADKPTYVIYSYRTPIGWVTVDGHEVYPKAHYSLTTSQHQSIVRMAFGVQASAFKETVR